MRRFERSLWQSWPTGQEVMYIEMDDCCSASAASVMLRSADQDTGFYCFGCRTMWERVSPPDPELARKINILRGKE